MQIVIDYAFRLAESPELLIILFRLGHFKFHKLMDIVAVPSPFRTTEHQFECIEIVINVIDKIIQIIGRQFLALRCFSSVIRS